MQIFIKNMAMDGKTVTLDVDPTDMVTAVKAKIEAKVGIPSSVQGLTINSKPLEDNMPLLHYRIQKGSLLVLHAKFNSPAQSKVSAGTSSAAGVDWARIASEAKLKIDQAVAKKNLEYNTLVEKKKAESEKLREVEKQLKFHEKEESLASKLIADGERKIKAMKESLQKAKLSCEGNISYKKEATRKRTAKKEELDSIQAKIAKMDEEIKEVCTVDVESHEKQNLSFRKFLKETISKKESDLKCPVCYQVSPPPLYKCLKEHLVCSQCFPRVGNKCPTCRSSFSKNSDKIFRLAEENWRELQTLKSKL